MQNSKVSTYNTIIVFLSWIGGMSPVWVEGRSSWLQRLFTWVHHLVSSVMMLDTLLLSRWHTTQIEQEHEIYYDDYYTEKETITKSLFPHKRNAWRLLLLLLPLIFLAGKWIHLLKFFAHLWLTSCDLYFQNFCYDLYKLFISTVALCNYF
jgi:hypothetical protein